MTKFNKHPLSTYSLPKRQDRTSKYRSDCCTFTRHIFRQVFLGYQCILFDVITFHSERTTHHFDTMKCVNAGKSVEHTATKREKGLRLVCDCNTPNVI